MTDQRLEGILALTGLVLLALGCALVLAPFVSALLWAVIVCYSTWGVYSRLDTVLGGRPTISALAMTLLLATVLVLPVVVVGTRLGENAETLAQAIRRLVAEGMPAAPPWVEKLPVVGGTAARYWAEIESNWAEVVVWLQEQAVSSTTWLLNRGVAFGEGLLQITLSVFASFYFYRDGRALAARLSAGLERIAGAQALHLLHLAGNTVKGVVYGILGTALAQGTVAALGFAIAGVPGPFLLGLLVCLLSVVPVGPPLVWISAGFWLFNEDQPGWAVFMLVYGFFVISGIDNIVKPLLISQGSALPFLLVLLGVLGGILAFGIVGIFLGPVLLAVAYALLRDWTRGERHEHRSAGDTPA